jgi:L-arabinokinase
LEIVFYTSDHGFGHAMRAIFLAEELIRRGAHCHFVCDRPLWLFSRLPAASFSLHRRQIDPGLQQSDWLNLDVSGTVKRRHRLYRNLEDLISTEVAFLRDIDAALVVAETAPLGLEIAARAEIPGVVSANFDWHWLYRKLSEAHPELGALATEAYEWYQKSVLALRLPFAVGLEETFADLRDVPLLVGKTDRDPIAIRQELGLPTEAPVLMWNIGGHPGSTPDFDDMLASLPEWHLVSYAAFDTDNPRYHRIDPRFNTTEIFSVLDGLIGKLGYCTCAEAHAFQVPFLFFARHGYPEDDALAEHTLRLVPSAPLVPADLESERWLEKFQAVIRLNRSKRPRQDGSTVAADYYTDLLV